MEIDNFGSRTLEELPKHCMGYRRDVFKFICLNMIQTGFHKWGFVIYRCAYGDDELWARYLAQLKDFCHGDLVKNRRAELLEQYLDWVVIEDRNTLDGASWADARRHFNRWVAEQKHPTPDTGKLGLRTTVSELPAFGINANDGSEDPELLPSMVFAVLDGSWTLDHINDYEPMNKGGYPPIDGSDRRYVGWQYCNAFCVAAVYDELHSGLDNYMSYRRPPAISPGGDESMSS